MKKIIVVLLILAAGTAAFANGAQEESEERVVELNRGELNRNSFLEDLDEIELKGTIKYESPIPELNSGGTDYSLMAPGAREYMDYIREGDSITVTGYILDEDWMPGSRGGRLNGLGMHQDFEAVEGNTVIFLETVTIDGTTYELPWVNEDFSGRNSDRGRHSGGMQGDKNNSRNDNRGWSNS
ncbi:MAG TPA: hypothetical protein DCO79_14265 [Spirochaeta sp.]|nr:hypothetical protein [Spirochaeta sp.]